MNDARDEEGKFRSFEEEIYWRYIKRISFCTTFRSDFQHKLKIPEKFADKIRSNVLHPKMTLRGPSGANWEVDMIRVGDDLFIQNGWQEFANAYSLQENDILLFKYDRNSTFSVKIFSGECEKIGAYFVKKCGHASHANEIKKKRVISETEEVENGVDDEVCTNTKKSRKNNGISKKILSNRKRVQSAINLVRKKTASGLMMGKQGRDSHAETEREHNSLSNEEVFIQSGFENIALPAKRVETEPDKQHGQNSLNNDEIPHQSGFENIVLPAKRAETGPTKQHEQNSFNKNDSTNSLVPISAETGPAKRQKHNSLSNNEVPRQIGSESIALPATTRAETGPAKQQKDNSQSNKKVPRQSGFGSIVLPATRAEIGPAKQHKTNNEVPHQSGFVNTATRGEIELAKQPEKYVSIKRELAESGTENVASPGTRGRRTTSLRGPADIECISNRRPVTIEEKDNAMRKAASELSENSFFVSLPISSCYKYFNLTIPSRFARAHLGLKNQEVSLCMGNKKWITKFSFSMGGLCAGWKKFALHNNLEESDVCLFKLVNQKSGEPVMLEVTIFRVVDEVTPPTLSIVK